MILVPIVAGLAWIASASGSGWAVHGLATIPGALLLGFGVASWLWPGDPRPIQAGALVAGLCVPLALLSFAWAGLGGGIALFALSAAAFMALGECSLRALVPESDVPAKERTPALAAAVACDEALLGIITPMALRHAGQVVPGEAAQAIEFLRERGWLEKPETYHGTPPPLVDVDLRGRRHRSIVFEQLSFESGYVPHPDEPGAGRWSSYDACRTAHAWVLRHRQDQYPRTQILS